MATIQKRFTNVSGSSELKFASDILLTALIITPSILNNMYVNLTAGIYIAGKEIEIHSYEITELGAFTTITVFYSEFIPKPQLNTTTSTTAT